MTVRQSSEQEQGQGIKDRFIDFVAAFQGPFATQLLSDLGRDRPELTVHYPEIDSKIQKMLQAMLNEAGYSHITVQSVGKDPKNPFDYPYTYLLVPREKDPKWAEKFLPNVFGALAKATRITDIEFAYNQEKRLVLVKLRQNNRFHVQGIGHGIE